MATMTKDAVREIIENFHDEIEKSARKTAKPSLAVINFRDELQEGVEREVVKVPINLLRYRKENGRFQRPEEIMNVKGIGEKIFTRIQANVFVEAESKSKKK